MNYSTYPQVLFDKLSVVHATEEYCKQQEKMGFYNGWGSAFERLATLISNFKN